ncbi:class I SAM-dependent methyltransferase [Membranihabitans marinus]|uniref:class I SAM-dependent methyltransferase n=1 Tax=Membranihabitans marinus TaxID=1227546 RepID=UPI001F1D5491|nr:class I SAM-dependent methyltransferase [Membranihabitans marinus]
MKPIVEFWEANFKEKLAMWGLTPAASSQATAEWFKEKGLRKILIPGFGYGRNAIPFIKEGQEVTGIEISKTAIELGQSYCGSDITVFHGSVNDMPYSDAVYDGVYCYALIHLLNAEERGKLIENCYAQLRPGGYMVFVTISTNDPSYGKGEKLSENYFQSPHGVKLYFYDKAAIIREFGDYEIIESKEVDEIATASKSGTTQKFWYVVCRKP